MQEHSILVRIRHLRSNGSALLRILLQLGEEHRLAAMQISVKPQSSSEPGESHLDATLAILPALISQGGQPAFLRCEALGFLQRVAHGAGSDLGVLIVPIIQLRARTDEEGPGLT
jgi:hypothetical protein